MHIKYHFMTGLFQENLAQNLLIQPGMYSFFEVTPVTVTFFTFFIIDFFSISKDLFYFEGRLHGELWLVVSYGL